MPISNDFNIWDLYRKKTAWTELERKQIREFLREYRQTEATFRSLTDNQLRGMLSAALKEIYQYDRKKKTPPAPNNFSENFNWAQLKQEFEAVRDNFVKWVSPESTNDLLNVVNKIIQKQVYYNQPNVHQSLQGMADALQRAAAGFQQFSPGQMEDPQEIVQNSMLKSLATWTLPELITDPQQTFNLDSVPQIDTDGQSAPVDYSQFEQRRLAPPKKTYEQGSLLSPAQRKSLYISLINKFLVPVNLYMRDPREYRKEPIQRSLNEVKNHKMFNYVENEFMEIIKYIEELLQKPVKDVPEFGKKVHDMLREQLLHIGQKGDLKKTFNVSIRRLIRKG